MGAQAIDLSSGLVPNGIDLTAGLKPKQAPAEPALPKITKEMDDDSIIRAFGYDPAKIKASPLFHGGLSGAVDGTQSPLITDTDKRVAQGIADPVLGTLQLLAHGASKAGVLSGNSKDYVDLLVKLNEANYQQSVRHGDTSLDLKRGAGTVAGALATGQPETLLGRAALGAGVAAVANPETGDTSNLLPDAAKKAALGAVLTPVAEGLTTAAGKTFGYVAGKFGAAKAAAAAGSTIPADAQVFRNEAGEWFVKASDAEPKPISQNDAIEHLAQQHGVPMTAGDVTGKPLLQRQEVLAESVPFSGMAKFRQGQQADVRNAASSFIDTLKRSAADTPHDQMELIDQAAKEGVRGAQALKDAIENAGDDTNRIIKNSGVAGIMTRKFKASVLYDRVGSIAADMGDVPIPQTMSAIQSAKAELLKAGLPDKNVLNVLNTLEQRLTPSAEVPPGALTRNMGGQDYFSPDGGKSWNPITGNGGAPAADTTFNGMRGIDSDLGEKIAAGHTGTNAIIGQKGVWALQSVKDAVRADMDQFASSGGTRGASDPAAVWKNSAGLDDFVDKSKSTDLQDAWKQANDYYKNNLVPYKSRALAAGLGPDVPADEIFGKFVQQGREGRADLFYNALDSKGQAAVRAGIAERAFDKALSESNNVFSPVKFASAIRKQEAATNVFFKGESKWELDGMTKLMDHVERAGQAAENPPTGNRTVPVIIGAALSHNPVTGIAGIVGVRQLTKLTTSPTGRRLLLSAASAKVGSPAMDRIVAQIVKAFPALAGTASANAVR